MELNNKNVLILGLSKSGIAAAHAAQKQGAKIFISEGRSVKPEFEPIVKSLQAVGTKIETEGHSDDFINSADLVQARGFRRMRKLYKKSKPAGLK